MPERDGATFTFFVNNNEAQTSEHELSGSQVKDLGRVPADYELFEVVGDHTVPIGNQQPVKMHNQMHFRAIPPGTFGLAWLFLQN